jgi:hypothetical protein
MAMLGTTLVFGVGKGGVTYAQEQGMGPGASGTASEKDKPASRPTCCRKRTP